MFNQSLSYLYQVLLCIIYTFIHILGLFNKKIYNWLTLKKDWKLKLRKNNLKECIWIHVASVGEFEMAVPLIREIKKQNKEQRIAVSFFSISGIKFYDNHELVDYFFLLPKDYIINIINIINIITPKCLIIVRNERWLNLIYQTYKKKIPIYQIEVERKNYNFIYQYYINYLNRFFTKIFYVENGSLQLENIITYQKKSIENIKEFCANNLTIILGSCYIEEVKMIAEYYKRYQDLKIIICPHNIESETFRNYQKLFNVPIDTYSSNQHHSRILFIDKIGVLKYLYQYTDFAFIGGGFKHQLHNIFEAGIDGNIVITGNNISNTYLNNLANKAGLIYQIKNFEELNLIINNLKNASELINKNKEKWRNFFSLHHNKSQDIFKTILPNL